MISAEAIFTEKFLLSRMAFPENPFCPTEIPRVGGLLVSRLTHAIVTIFACSIVPVTIKEVGKGNNIRCGPKEVFITIFFNPALSYKTINGTKK
jgi:hypothetical protein